MTPSKSDISSFIAFAPDASEGQAFAFLEGSSNLEEAVNQYYADPSKYSQEAAPAKSKDAAMENGQTPVYSPPPYPPVTSAATHRAHTNAVIEAAHVRARDEQDMQNLLQNVQMNHRIYNSDLEPEHDSDYYCGCDIHQYKSRKYARLRVLDMWNKAVMYPGEKSYHDCYRIDPFSSNPYRLRVVSPYGYGMSSMYYIPSPDPGSYTRSVHQTIQLNNKLNAEAQAKINAKEPTVNIWEIDELESSMSKLQLGQNKSLPREAGDEKSFGDEKSQDKRKSVASLTPATNLSRAKSSRFSSFRQALNIRTTEEKASRKTGKAYSRGTELRDEILREEQGKWPDADWRRIVYEYQEHTGMSKKIADLRLRQPIQYLHLLRAGYFEPIPRAWADQQMNPLKFSIDSTVGWRGITPAWRGYEDTAEERLYWVLNHREGSTGTRLKPDMISALDMARARMASAVEPPPAYFSADDTCHVQHTSEGYSKQVMPAPFMPYDAKKATTDDTMILLDTSGSMDFEPVRPIYNQYLITNYTRSTQPKNKDTAKAVIRRFTDAMANYDHNFQGYNLVTFANHASDSGVITHQNLNNKWNHINFGGGTRVMSGWQKVKEVHFQKHSESATHHPVYGWQAGPETPTLRLLLLLDGEATDMDEFETDLLSNSWAHVTIFLIGVDGCPHHHRHANELQRISDVNHHVSFVDAQGNTPERFVTHELLKRHLGYELSLPEFEELEQPPPYAA